MDARGGRAIPLIRLVDEKRGTYEVCAEAHDVFEDVGAPFGAVAIVGKYRTGKSYFMNRCLLRDDRPPSKGARAGSAFPVGNTVQACTKGLWCYTVPMRGGDMPIYVLDTEGIGALDASDTNDSRIFSMALLLSSFFIYNSLNAIDEEALNQLSLVTNVCKGIQIDAGREATAEELGREVFPPLFWMVRDFSLQLKDEYGGALSPTQYLESALKDRSGPDGEDKNRLRKCIRDCFPNRACATLIRPCSDEAQLQTLQSMSDKHLKPVFRQQLDWIRDYVLKTTRPKASHGGAAGPGVPMTGKSFLAYAGSIVRAINAGSAPVIRNAWSMLSELHCRDAVDQCFAGYREAMDREPPSAEPELAALWKEAKLQALSAFRERCHTLAKSGTDVSAAQSALLDRMEDHRRSVLDELRRLDLAALNGKLAEISAVFSASDSALWESIRARRLEQFEADFRRCTDALLRADKPCACGCRAVLRQFADHSWSWLRRLGACSQSSLGTLKHLEAECEDWKLKAAAARADNSAALEAEQTKYGELQSKLSALNDALTRSLADKESELATLRAKAEESRAVESELRSAARECEEANSQTLSALREKCKELEAKGADELGGALEESRDALRKAQLQLQQQREKFLADLKDMRERSDAVMQQAKGDCERRVEEERQRSAVIEAQKGELEKRISAKEHEISLLQETDRRLEDKFAALERSHARDVETFREQWERHAAKHTQTISRLQEERVQCQIEWSDKIRAAETTAATQDAQAKEYKRRLDKVSDPTKVKRLKRDNEVLERSLAKAETENEWLRRIHDASKASLDKLKDEHERLSAEHYELQREKETEIMNLTLNHYKQLHPNK